MSEDQKLTELQQRVLAALGDKPQTARGVYAATYPGMSIRGRAGAGRRSGIAKALGTLEHLGLAVQANAPRARFYDDRFVYTRAATQIVPQAPIK